MNMFLVWQVWTKSGQGEKKEQDAHISIPSVYAAIFVYTVNRKIEWSSNT